jgi:hypothetical protein
MSVRKIAVAEDKPLELLDTVPPPSGARPRRPGATMIPPQIVAIGYRSEPPALVEKKPREITLSIVVAVSVSVLALVAFVTYVLSM